MRLTALLLVFPSSVILAFPTSNEDTTPTAMISRFVQSDECNLPSAPTACSGATQRDVIVQYGKTMTDTEKALFLNAAKAAGATIQGDMSDFGFTGFVPGDVVDLIAAHGKAYGVAVYENGCAGVPWCGEAPC